VKRTTPKEKERTMPNTITISRTITITQGLKFVGKGALSIVVTPGTPPNGATVAATFTPDQTTTAIPITQNTLTWTSTANGSVLFGFNVTGSQIGGFPVGSYTFTGTQQANGDPTGTVLWPSVADSDEDSIEGTETDTWQASGGGGGGEDEPSVSQGEVVD
jgi:hypothetical protein